MRIDVVTLFPDWFDWFAGQRHVANALAAGHELRALDLREHTPLSGGQVDDTPFGGGAGMVLKPEPLAAALQRGAASPSDDDVVHDVASHEHVSLGNMITREPLPTGWSIHEIGTARMGDDPKTSVTDRFCRLHDVKNVYLADGAPLVSGGTQNTTWSILAMCWRTMDHLKESMRAGEV